VDTGPRITTTTGIIAGLGVVTVTTSSHHFVATFNPPPTPDPRRH